MADDALDRSGSGDIPPEWESMLREILGPQADEAIAAMRESGFDASQLAEAAGMTDPATFRAAMDQIKRMFAGAGADGVNWDVAHDLARQVAVTDGDPVVSDPDSRASVDALAVAELWLDAATDFPQGASHGVAWSRSEWVERTMPAWRSVAEPVAVSMAEAMAQAMGGQLGALGGIGSSGEPGDELSTGADSVEQQASLMMRRIGGTVFAMQVGQAVGTLSREVFGSTDVSLPLVPEAVTALVPSNVAAFADGLDAPIEETRLFLALREVAHTRLFAHVPWLRGHLFGLVESYARGIAIDMERLEESVRSIDPSDTEALRDAMSGGVFSVETTPAQKAVLARLETALALVEGWVDTVVGEAASMRLPHAQQLREMIRRRRAAGGPAEHTFATLVGLDLRPRRARDAAALWAVIEARGGIEGRDAVWAHPDLLPTAEDLDDPSGFFARQELTTAAEADLDAALAEIFGDASEGLDADGPNSDDSGDGDADEPKSE